MQGRGRPFEVIQAEKTAAILFEIHHNYRIPIMFLSQKETEVPIHI